MGRKLYFARSAFHKSILGTFRKVHRLFIEANHLAIFTPIRCFKRSLHSSVAGLPSLMVSPALYRRAPGGRILADVGAACLPWSCHAEEIFS